MSDGHDDSRSEPAPDGPGDGERASGQDPSETGGSGAGAGQGGGRRRRGRSRRGRRGGRARSDEGGRPQEQPRADDQLARDEREPGGTSAANGQFEPARELDDEAVADDEADGHEDEGSDTVRSSGAARQEMALVVYLARSGVGSRRRCDELIREGVVSIDGSVVTFPREKVSPDAEVTVDGEVVTPREYRYVLVNKPRGVASTRSDPHAERVLVDLVPDGRTLFPVGRLDVNTTGLIVLTNDGVLANRLMHPRYGVPKTYLARVRGRVGKRALTELRAGVELEEGRTAPAEARLEKQGNKTALVELTIHEGRKRQVRRMLAALGLPVEELHRRRYGPLSDKNLKVGAWRQLSGEEVEALRRAGEEADRRVAGDDPGEAVDLAAPQEPLAAPQGEGAGDEWAPTDEARRQAAGGPTPPVDEPRQESAGDDSSPADEATDGGQPA